MPHIYSDDNTFLGMDRIELNVVINDCNSVNYFVRKN